MTIRTSRRDLLRGGLAAAGLGVLGIPRWALPVLAQGETLVPFTDIPENVRWETPPDRRLLDVSTIDGPFTPRDKFATTQHYGHPEVNPATFRLKVSGLVDRPKALSLDDLKKLGSTELVAGFECSGNRGPLQGLCGNGKWTGVPLKAVLDAAGVKAAARDVVFFGADHGEEEVEWRTQKYKIDYQFGRSLPREKAMSGEPFLTWALNGEPLSKHQGAPLRLIVPGWYGVSNVKWLSEAHPQEEQYLGKYQARWYRTV
jgi:DMSO/TMAO reductase YedYZ molybdopterin-dependent catalytic subunit